MPRPTRIHLDNVPVHIVQRGHNRQPCFIADADYLAYLEWLADAARRNGCQAYADTLMTNQVQPVAVPARDDDCQMLLKPRHVRYTQDAMLLIATSPLYIRARGQFHI